MSKCDMNEKAMKRKKTIKMKQNILNLILYNTSFFALVSSF